MTFHVLERLFVIGRREQHLSFFEYSCRPTVGVLFSSSDRREHFPRSFLQTLSAQNAAGLVTWRSVQLCALLALQLGAQLAEWLAARLAEEMVPRCTAATASEAWHGFRMYSCLQR